MELTFHGGARDVTGANYLLQAGEKKFLIECGLHQGSFYAERQNFEPFPYNPKEINAVFITHAHLDHVGRLPKLFQDGFRGKIYSTPPTKDFAEYILLDSQSILAKEAAREGEPEFYSEKDVEGVMQLWEGIPYHTQFEVGGSHVTFFDAGHILGSAIIKIEGEGRSIIFSGDLGNYPAPIIRPTEFVTEGDYCLIESTYGDRVHDDVTKRREMLEDVIEDSAKAGGVLLIPAFALERTQEILYHLHELFEEGRIPKMPVFIDSPLAIKLTEVYKKYASYFNEESNEHDRKPHHNILDFPELHLTMTTEESKSINNVPPPKIIIAGSGMSHGGRILHHERRYLSDLKNTILFVGYQAPGSLGRRILEGAPAVTIFGEEIPVHCHIRTISSYSAHADQPRLLEWLSFMRGTLKKVFVVQGEEKASMVLQEKIRDTLALQAEVPEPGDKVVLE